MNIYEKLKSNIQVRKFEKYTKRRSFIPEFDSRGIYETIIINENDSYKYQ
jgi:hypothetical protein